jgi:hypothetical protein
MLDIVYWSSAIRARGERGWVCVFVYSPTIAARPAGIPLYGIVPQESGSLGIAHFVESVSRIRNLSMKNMRKIVTDYGNTRAS